jgi:hypothetical protein
MKPTKDTISPIFQFDSIYSVIFSDSPELLFVLKTQIIRPGSLEIVLDSLPLNYKIFQPFFGVLGLVNLPFNDGDSPVDFLTDPRRAGNLYSDPHDIADAFMRLWIPWQKRNLLHGECLSWSDLQATVPRTTSSDSTFRQSLKLLDQCHSCPTILQGIETLDLAQICDPMYIDEEHWEIHELAFHTADLSAVLRWLRVSFIEQLLKAHSCFELPATP